MAFKCPACGQPLYNRRRATCESCGAAVPESLRLSPTQQKQFEVMKEREKKEHREFMERQLPGGGTGGDVGAGF